MLGMSAAVLMDGARSAFASEIGAAERPFGAGAHVPDGRIQRLLDRELVTNLRPKPVAVEFDPADMALPEPVRIGKRLAEYMAAQPVVIREDEEFVGWLPFDHSVESDLYRRYGHKEFFRRVHNRFFLKPQDRFATQESQHTSADFPKVIREGLVGIRRDIAASRERWAGDKDRLDYLRGMDLALDGIERRVAICVAECRRLADAERDPARRATLLEVAERLERVPMQPARTFDEGVQSVFFCFEFLSDAIGRLDQYLAPLYFADLAAGRTTPEKAAERLQELFIFIDAHTPPDSPYRDKGGECHMTVGGLTPDGRDAWTDFSRLVVESCLALNLIRPQMSFRWHPGTKREVLRFMLDCERRDPNMRIAFQGDEPHVKSLVANLGFPLEVARDYIATGCNEGAFSGGFSTGGCKINICRSIVRVFNERRDEALTCQTWEEFAAVFAREFAHTLEDAEWWCWKFNEQRSFDCNVLSALFMAGCVERAKSPTRGGASRAWAQIGLVGMPNLIDSLSVVKQFVFDEKRCTMQELADALAADWKGHEKLLGEIRRDGRFYGENDPESNAMARFLHLEMAKFAKGRKDYFGNPYSYGNHVGYNEHGAFFGRITGATPDGRRTGEFFSFGSGPAAGRGSSHATSVLLAVAQMDPAGMMCGAPVLNLSVPPSCTTDEGDFEKLVVLVETYFRQGGYHLQLNHVTRETLIDAQKHPEKYANLRVRVSGFSGYFVKMRKEIQDEIIARLVASVR